MSTNPRSTVGTASKERGRKPVVFMFQPTEFVPVPPDKMTEWEAQLRLAVGPMADSLHKALQSQALLETTSLCPGAGADDCDVIEHDPI